MEGMYSKTSIGKKIILIALIALSVVAVLYGIKYSQKGKIMHSKQYLVPGDGQLVYYKDYQTDVRLPLLFYDEIDMSEMADGANFTGVKVFTEQGNCIEANSWKVESVEIYGITDLYCKMVYVFLPIREDCKLTQVEIEYIDGSERFELGEISTYGISLEVLLSSLWIGDLLSDINVNNRTNEGGVYLDHMNFLDMTIDNNYSPLTLCAIDLGIEGLEVDMESIKREKSNIIDIVKYSKNKNYNRDRSVSEARRWKEVEIPLGMSVYVASVCGDIFQEAACRALYYNPVYVFCDEEGISHEWAAVGECRLIGPHIVGTAGKEQTYELLNQEGL